MTILMICYVMFAVGVYRGALDGGWREGATVRQKWRARVRVATLAAVWPYLIGFGTQRPKVAHFY